jgi:regulatory protein RepA
MALDPTRPLNLMSFGAILAEPFPAVDWDIEPLVAHGSRVVIAGMYGSLKSWVLPHMGLSLAAGIDWLNRFRVSRPRRTLFIDEEMSVPGLARRVRRLAKGLGLESPALPFQALSRAGIRFDASGAAWLLQKLKESQFDPEVIFVETLRRVIVGSENDAKDVGEFWRGVDPIMQAGKTLLVSHHMRKPSRQGNDQMRDRVSGSTDIMAGSDSDITIHRPHPGYGDP